MKHRLSFGYFNLLTDNILEVTVDEGVVMTLEMIEECHQFVDKYLTHNFGMLINRINNYNYTYEAQLSIASYQGLKAIAFVYYDATAKETIQNLQEKRMSDAWNYQIFSGLELGWQQAFQWLENELSLVKVSE
jgi:hypothetical protein